MIVGDGNVYKLSNIIRYSQLSKIKRESVAEHSFYVSWFANRLCTWYKLPDIIRLMALEAAILHDIPEVITNDITYDVKQMIPEVSGLLQPYEKAIIKEHSERVYGILFDPLSCEQQIAKALVKHADILSVMQYCTNEEDLGNKSFIKLKQDTETRIEKSKQKVESLIEKWRNKNAKEHGDISSKVTDEDQVWCGSSN